MKRGVSRDELDVLLLWTKLKRYLGGGEEPHHVEQEPRWEHDDALADHLGLHRHPQADIHVGRPELAAPGLGGQLDSRERLNCTAGRGDPAHGLKLAEQSVALQGDLHDEYLRWNVEVIGSSEMWKTARSAAASGKNAG